MLKVKKMNEIWKDITGLEGIYQISNLGRVKSLERKRKGPYNRIMHLKEKIIKGRAVGIGYYAVQIERDGSKKNNKIHKLVAEHFISNPENKPCVNHINGIKTDNRVENLEWVTHSENNQHAYDKGLKISLKGEKSGRSKLKNTDIVKIREMLAQGTVIRLVAEKYNVSLSAIATIKTGKTWKNVA